MLLSNPTLSSTLSHNCFKTNSTCNRLLYSAKSDVRNGFVRLSIGATRGLISVSTEEESSASTKKRSFSDSVAVQGLHRELSDSDRVSSSTAPMISAPIRNPDHKDIDPGLHSTSKDDDE